MNKAEHFSTGYSEFELGGTNDVQMFVSITPELTLGPSIRRDGITNPTMFHPDDVSEGNMPYRDTSDEFEQRARSWTIFNHLKNFCRKMGKEWRILGAQGFGDLSMNPWVLAVLKNSSLCGGRCEFSRLGLPIQQEYQEPVYEMDKIYTSLVKYKTGEYKFEDVSFALRQNTPDEPYISRISTDGEMTRIENEIEFLVSGKPLLRGNQTVPLYSVIERYSDIRHIFATPRYDYRIPLSLFHWNKVCQEDFGSFKQYFSRKYNLAWIEKRKIKITQKEITVLEKPNHNMSITMSEDEKTAELKIDNQSMDVFEVSDGLVLKRLFRTLPLNVNGRPTFWIYFGERDLFDGDKVAALNRRRQALNTPLKIAFSNYSFPGQPLPNSPDWVDLEMSIIKQWEDDNSLEVSYPPNKPGQFRLIRQSTNVSSGHDNRFNGKSQIAHIEVFFRRNVYPFTAIGIKRKKDKSESTKLVMLASAGKQFLMGDTIETMAQKMEIYGACSDAMIMDEGNDVFQLVNKDGIRSNEFILDVTAAKVTTMIDRYPKISKIRGNQEMLEELKQHYDKIEVPHVMSSNTNLFSVEPQRPQLRAVLIVAEKKG